MHGFGAIVYACACLSQPATSAYIIHTQGAVMINYDVSVTRVNVLINTGLNYRSGEGHCIEKGVG